MSRMKQYGSGQESPEMQSGSQRMAAGLHEIAGGAADLIAAGRDRSLGALRDSMTRSKSQLRMVGARAADRAYAAGHGAERYVAESPWRTIAIVAAVGLIAGWLLRGSDSDRGESD